MHKRSFTSEAVDGMAWQGLAVGANVVLRATILILLARTIDVSAFGIIAAAMVVISIAEKFSQIGVPRVLVQQLTLARSDIKNAFAISLHTGIIATAAIFLTAPLLASLFQIADLTLFSSSCPPHCS